MSLMRLNVQFVHKQDCLTMQWAALERALEEILLVINSNMLIIKKRKASSYIEMFLMVVNSNHSTLKD
jgi:hypothetical protein